MAMGTKEKITEVLRRSPLTPRAYFDIKATDNVPVGSFDRTLSALVGDGTVHKGGNGYRLAGDGSANIPEETRAGSGILVYCTLRRGAPAPGQGKRGDAGGCPPAVQHALA